MSIVITIAKYLPDAPLEMRLKKRDGQNYLLILTVLFWNHCALENLLNFFFVPRFRAQAKTFKELKNAKAIPQGIDDIEDQHKDEQR